VGDCFRWFREIIKVIVVEPDRGKKLAGISRGIWDGLRVGKKKAPAPRPEAAGESR
jgi:hypothetical protein